MDDIYFSRRKNNDEPKRPQSDSDNSYNPENDDGKFNLNFAPVDKSSLENKLNRTSSSHGASHPVYSDSQSAYSRQQAPQYTPTSDETQRLPISVLEQMQQGGFSFSGNTPSQDAYPHSQSERYDGHYADRSAYQPHEDAASRYGMQDKYQPQNRRDPQGSSYGAGRTQNDSGFSFEDIDSVSDAQTPYAAGSAAYSEPYEDDETPKKKKKKAGSNHVNSNKKKKGKGFKVFISLLLIILICFGGIGIYGFRILSSLSYNTEGIKKNEYISSSELASSSKVKNILLLGCDDAKGSTYSRSDTMMLVSIDTAHKCIKLTSFLRDSYVYIPQKDHKAKLNSASSAGGAQYAIDTIEYNFHVDIDSYVLVDFEMFEDLVNALGGVDVEVTKKEATFLNEHCSFGKNGTTPATEGVNHFEGWKALTYCRIRKLSGESDVNRTARQRKVISAIIAKAKSAQVFSLINKLDVILPLVETDIGKLELMNLGMGALTSYLRYDIVQMQIPVEGLGCAAKIKGQDVLKLDIEKNQKALYDFIYVSGAEETTAEE